MLSPGWTRPARWAQCLAVIAPYAILRFTYYTLGDTLYLIIRSFNCKHIQALFEEKLPRRFRAISGVIERKLMKLQHAATLIFLSSLPGNCLEALKGNRV